MHTYYHAKSSVKEWGGQPSDYMPVHEFIDQSKVAMADVRHRAMLHHTLGTRLAEQCLGVVIINSAGTEVPVRLIAEKHIIEDLGFLPTPQDWLKCVSLKAIPWAGGNVKKLLRHGVPVARSIQEKVKGHGI